jgi:antitoxin (DNA-binding transcriptional repressor) of toxin-antitoxin stability system
MLDTMIKTVTATALRTEFLRLIPDLTAGYTFNITKHGKVIARLCGPEAVSAPAVKPAVKPVVAKRPKKVKKTIVNARSPKPEVKLIDQDMRVVVEEVAEVAPVKPVITESTGNEDLEEALDLINDIVETDDTPDVSPEPEVNLNLMTMKELHAYARSREMTVPPRLRKSEVLAFILGDIKMSTVSDDEYPDIDNWLDEDKDDKYDAYFNEVAEDNLTPLSR